MNASENSDSDSGNTDGIRTRKNIARKSEWAYKVNRKKRMEGLQYFGISNKEQCLKPHRKLGVTCSSQFCKKKCA